MRLSLLVGFCVVALGCGAFGASIEAKAPGKYVVEFAIANRTAVPQEVVFYRVANDHAPDATRKRVQPNTRIVVLIDQYRVKYSQVPEIEIVGIKTLRDVDVSTPTELVIFEGTVAKAEAGFREIAVPTARHAELVAQAEAEQKRIDAVAEEESKRRRAAEDAQREAMLKRPDQPGYKLGPKKTFKVGDAVVGFWRGKYWYQGYVVEVGRGTVTLEYSDDGTREKLAAQPSNVRHRIGGRGRYVAPVAAPPAMPSGYWAGQKVTVNWEEQSAWFVGRVSDIEPNGTVLVRLSSHPDVVLIVTNADNIKRY